MGGFLLVSERLQKPWVPQTQGESSPRGVLSVDIQGANAKDGALETCPSPSGGVPGEGATVLHLDPTPTPNPPLKQRPQTLASSVALPYEVTHALPLSLSHPLPAISQVPRNVCSRETPF